MATGERQLRVIVLGAGMAGILSGIRLLQAGIDCVIYEKVHLLRRKMPKE